MKKSLIVILSMVIGSTLAEEYTLNSDFANDWNDPKSYKTSSGAVAETLPGREDTVLIPKDISSVTIDDNSIAVVEAFKYLYPVERSRNVKIIIDISKDVNFRCFLNNYSKNIAEVTSHLVKKGKGALYLGNVAQVTSPSGHYNYNTVITVEEGMLVLPQNLIRYSNLYAGGVTVEKDAVLFLPSPGNFRCEILNGSGIVTNDMLKGGTQLQPQHVNARGVFSGVLAGNFNFGGKYDQFLTGIDNTFSGSITIDGSSNGKKACVLGLAKLGNVNEPSSSGKNDKITFAEGSTAGSTGGGKLVYLGDGTLERSNKPLYFADTGYCPVTIDGGANGGLEMEGAWTMSSAQMIRIVLDGSNKVNECAFLGAFNNKVSGDKTSYTARITKKGSGIWRFGDNEKRKNSGVIAVQEGTLRFDSIAEKGAVCSLGLSTDLYEDVSGEKPETTVPYAFLLGGGETEGTMEYTGSGTGVCSTRPFAVNGKGRIRAKGSSLQLANAFAYSAGSHILTLDGDTTGNILRNVEDGVSGGVLSVAKDGIGTWTLVGNQTFSGGISVNAGTLVIRKSESVPFKWFRFTIKETARYSGRYTWTNPTWDDCTVRLWTFYLYDANGKVQTAGLEYNKDRFNLLEDQATWGFDTVPNPQTSEQGLAAMFHEAWQPMRVNFKYSLCKLSEPSTYLPIIIRLADSKPEITAVNMGMDIPANNDYCCGQPTAYSLEGSVDGENWVLLTEDNRVDLPTVAKTKVYQRARTFDVPARYVADKSFENPISVKLGANAILRSEYIGDSDKISISSLSIDAAGGSACSGFVFNETGTLDISNIGEDFEYGSLIDVDFGQESNWADLKNWKTTLNGNAMSSKYSVRISEEGVRVYKTGLVLSIR